MQKIHALAGALALLIICGFWLSTAITEAFGSRAAVVAVKTAIPWGLIVLIPALALAGAFGARAIKRKDSKLARRKLRRMPFIAANGLLVLVPSALYLASAARAGSFGAAFVAVQTLELLAGALNIALLGLNLRDGLRLRKRMPQIPLSN